MYSYPNKWTLRTSILIGMTTHREENRYPTELRFEIPTLTLSHSFLLTALFPSLPPRTTIAASFQIQHHHGWQIQSLPRMRSRSLVFGNYSSSLGCPYNSKIITNGMFVPSRVDQCNLENGWLIAVSLSSRSPAAQGLAMVIFQLGVRE